MEKLTAAALAQALAHRAEPVCRHYLSNGTKAGRYWTVGNVGNVPGRSLYVRLSGPLSGPGAAGKWRDAQTGEHGDLLDLIAQVCGLTKFGEIAAEAHRFLGTAELPTETSKAGHIRATTGSAEAARRLFARAQSIEGTLGERYLRGRGITHLGGASMLRFHPSCFHRDHTGTMTRLPALVAAITDNAGNVTGVHRTWLSPDGTGKAQVKTPRRAMGQLLGNGVRFGFSTDTPAPTMVAGEGLETMLSLRTVLPSMPMIAGLSAGHLGALILPHGVRQLYLAGDNDQAGRAGMERLRQNAGGSGLEVLVLRPQLGDFNDDLRRLGTDVLRRSVVDQLAPQDRAFAVLSPNTAL
ncbi:toprim domain-containing protein [Devosia rhizosphaerae]|uniref:DUF7146 domain-containing protein n=1 Tax=Devosia rhizosphaerae TaxID=3049774 RepID=UPI0039F44E1C